MNTFLQTSVPSALHTLFFYAAAVGCTFLVLQFILSLVGFGDTDGDVDLDADTDTDVSGTDADTDADADADSGTGIHGSSGLFSSFFQYLSLRSLVSFSAFFGLFGLLGESWELPAIFSAVLGILAGVFSAVCVTRTMRLLKKMNANGCTRFDSVVGLTGTVYIPIPAKRAAAGKIQIVINGRTEEMEAWTDGYELTTGTQVTVLERLGTDAVLVVLQ